jgi:hypothetical protein
LIYCMVAATVLSGIPYVTGALAAFRRHRDQV